MPRFFTDLCVEPGVPFELTDENARHISFSLRMRAGERVTVCSGGRVFDCTITGFTSSSVTLVAEAELDDGEPAVKVCMYIAVPKGDKLDFCIQKCVELGADEIVPFWSAHCITRGGSAESKGERRQKIAAEAAKQCGRGTVPVVRPIMEFDAAMARGAQANLPLFCSERADAGTLSDVIRALDRPVRTVSIVTGPEGGFAPAEFDAAAAAGYRLITLGRRILRCETAPLCALSAVMYAFGEF